MNKKCYIYFASFIIGNYILPRFLNNLKENIQMMYQSMFSVSQNIKDLLDKKLIIS